MKFRSAITGLFTSKGEAARHPDTTVAVSTEPQRFVAVGKSDVLPGDTFRVDGTRLFHAHPGGPPKLIATRDLKL